MDSLYSAWRMAHDSGKGSDGLAHVDLKPAQGKTLFETIEQSDFPDEQTYIIKRSELSFVIVNVFPYTPGHIMILPKRPVRTIDKLTNEEYSNIWELVREATIAIKSAFNPDGLNVGLNEGTAGGGSIPDHLHIHVVPRWSADTNFMTTIGGSRILPITLADSWARIKKSWPQT